MKLALIPAIAVCFLMASCSKDDQTLIDDQLIQQYLTTNSLTAQSTSSGVYYIIDVEGNGGNPSVTDSVQVNYTGFYLDGNIFDSSNGNPRKFKLSQLIQGWQIGIPLFQKGGQGTLFIPSSLGYGSNPPPGIPANSVLIFDIELLDWF